VIFPPESALLDPGRAISARAFAYVSTGDQEGVRAHAGKAEWASRDRAMRLLRRPTDHYAESVRLDDVDVVIGEPLAIRLRNCAGCVLDIPVVRDGDVIDAQQPGHSVGEFGGRYL
jgi:hypothetical protein